ncbi:MAG: protein kinase, partial [Planctomycetota bacterium]|nr:protein kinase [Planctomycetota bacterium]
MASATSAKEIEGHEIQGVISTTSRSTVYKAFQKEKNREVVLKTLSSRDGAVINRFVERAKGSSKLSHPNVARLFLAGADQSTGTPFVTMEFIQAPNLESIIRQKGRVPVNVGTKLLGQALLALSAAEKNGIRHTDLN